MTARQAVKMRGRRSAGDVIAGIAATLALVALVVGVPIALWTFFGSPLPSRLPDLSALTEQVGPSAIISVLAILVWLAWIQLLVCVVVELQAAIRGVGVPARVPLAGGTQSLVHRLVVSALLLFTVTTAVMPAFSARGVQTAPAPGAAATSASTSASYVPTEDMRLQAAHYDLQAEDPGATAVGQATGGGATAESLHAEPVPKSRAKKIYRVEPPHGRHHESLWEIAEKCLGDGRRYGEIYELNKGRAQPDGSELTIASLIRPGWVLEMPADAMGTDVVPARHIDDYREGRTPVEDTAPQESAPQETAPQETAPQESAPQESAPSQSAPEQTAPEQTAPEQTAPPETAPPQATAPAAPKAPAKPAPQASQPQTSWSEGSKAPETAPAREPAAPTPAQETHKTHKTQETHETRPAGADQVAEPGGIDLGWPEGLAAASLLAAGLLVALGGARRRQMWHRPFGRSIERPEDSAAVAEQALRFGADDQAVRLLDIALRQLSKALAAEGRTLPTVYGVHLGRTGLDLWVAPADRTPPAPWEAYDNGQVWRFGAEALDTIDVAGLADVLAPYPGLVSIGTNDTGRILVDLEAAHGLIALRGPDEVRRAALAAIATELATNRWSDHMRITLVGFGADLRLVAPDRIRSVASLAEALPELESRAEEVRQALAASGADSVLTGRCRGVFGEAWMPHYLIMADQPTPDEADRLMTLARSGHRMAAGYVVAGDVPGATWSWDIGPEGRLQAGVLGFDVAAQLIPDDQYDAIVELFHTAGRLDGAPLPEPGPVDAPPPADGEDGSAVDIRLLGPIEVDAPGPMDDSRRALCTELLIYLATHPGGVHPTVLGGAVWPRGVTAGVRDATIARVSDWLGRDSRGRPNLYYDDRGRIRLGSEVRIDWAVFRWLVWRSAAEPASETAYMSYALDLVHGPLLWDRPAGRYGWLAKDGLEYEVTARIVDVAHRLVVLRLDDDDPRGAVAAARAGLRCAPDDQGLWRDLLRATYADDPDRVPSVVEELHDLVDHDLTFDRLRPETEALIEEFLPHYHQVSARGA